MSRRPFQGSRLTGPVGNNTFAYEQRKLVDPDPKLRLPELKDVSSIDDIELGTLPTFTELDDDDNVITYTGLKYIYHMDRGGMDVLPYVPTAPIYIFDNHNYALYFWTQQRANYNHLYRVIHIDQHSDLATPREGFPMKMNGNNLDVKNKVPTELTHIAYYTTHICNVGNFIRPALEAGIITDCLRIKNQYDLEYTPSPFRRGLGGGEKYILDIDLDFRAPEMGTDLTKSIPLVQSLMRNASLITIASSPYFLDQNYALELLRKLFGK